MIMLAVLVAWRKVCSMSRFTLYRKSDILVAGPPLELDMQRPSHDDLMNRVELIKSDLFISNSSEIVSTMMIAMFL